MTPPVFVAEKNTLVVDTEQLLTMSTSTKQPGVLVQAPPSAQQQYGAPQPMQQVPQAPIAPIVQAAPMNAASGSTASGN